MVVTMSQVSSDIVREVAPEVEELYIPLTVDTSIFKPLPEDQWAPFKPKGRTMFFWNNRNARRKMSGSIVWWFKEFLDKVGHDKACLMMHTDPKDVHGPNLEAIINELGLTNGEVMFSPGRIGPQDLAAMYNLSDVTVSLSDAEGFGLSTMESLACEVPIIVPKTGGLQEQVKDDAGSFFGVELPIASQMIVGSQEVPFIY